MPFFGTNLPVIHSLEVDGIGDRARTRGATYSTAGKVPRLWWSTLSGDHGKGI